MKNNLVEGYKIHVGASSGYDVIISKGILCDAADYLCNVIKPCTACIITDDHVDPFYSS